MSETREQYNCAEPLAFPSGDVSDEEFIYIPSHFIDHVMPHISPEETVVALYILYHTFGPDKEGNTVSVAQMLDGSFTDRGTGLSRYTILSCLKGLNEKHIVEVVHRDRRDVLDDCYRIANGAVS